LTYYDKALELCPKELKLAASFPLSRVVEDCTEAIRCDSNYQKAYRHRSEACKQLRTS